MSSPPAGAPTGTATILFTDLVADLRRETGIERVALDGLDETAAGVRFPSTLWGRTVSLLGWRGGASDLDSPSESTVSVEPR